MLCGGLGGSILGVGLGIDSCPKFGGQVGTEIGDGTLNLAQESGEFVFLLGSSLVLRGLTRVILLLAQLARLALLTLLTVAISVWCLTLILVVLLRRQNPLVKTCADYGNCTYTLSTTLVISLTRRLGVTFVGVLELLEGVAQSSRAITRAALRFVIAAVGQVIVLRHGS